MLVCYLGSVDFFQQGSRSLASKEGLFKRIVSWLLVSKRALARYERVFDAYAAEQRNKVEQNNNQN
jgi:hypothetical protein